MVVVRCGGDGCGRDKSVAVMVVVGYREWSIVKPIIIKVKIYRKW